MALHSSAAALYTSAPSATQIGILSSGTLDADDKIYMKKNVIQSFEESWDGRIRTFAITGPKPVALPLGDAPFFIFETNRNLILNNHIVILFILQPQSISIYRIGVVLASFSNQKSNSNS